MTLDEAMEQALSDFDRRMADNLVNAATILVSHGATQEELTIEMAHIRADFAAERAEFATQLRAWFLRDGATLQ